ncbi:hypothetical protein OHB12_27275 [Nocardia sp. NBC_01730]|uniref:hypothetical protein n=1 Tax=Nocardia sp. NBC_01730 TaxID=2975998 RepID=UPI002E14E907|nr:hypothetical protein OHB12_27275 [Nocardia sp. NBC_01730]
MDFVACMTAALMFVQDWRAHHYLDDVTVVPGGTGGLPRLPNERLYLEPWRTPACSRKPDASREY